MLTSFFQELGGRVAGGEVSRPKGPTHSPNVILNKRWDLILSPLWPVIILPKTWAPFIRLRNFGASGRLFSIFWTQKCCVFFCFVFFFTVSFCSLLLFAVDFLWCISVGELAVYFYHAKIAVVSKGENCTKGLQCLSFVFSFWWGKHVHSTDRYYRLLSWVMS